MIDLKAAEELLDFSARLEKGDRAREQLVGAVALHNILERDRVAYLADEVGMGKTHVALGVVALFRHFQPSFRVAVIAPRRNIQRKWMKEFRNFVSHNVRYHDLHVKAVDGRPARPFFSCENLIEFVRETTLDPDRDFFLRLTSFSLPLAGDKEVDRESARRNRDALKTYLPWLSDSIFDLRRKQDFKDNFARAVNCVLPEFDLLIVDEGHNLKHGLSETVASRNRVLAFAFGHPEGRNDPGLFPAYGPRAKRVLFLSATPVEETYRHLWNQLRVFDLDGPYAILKEDAAEEEAKKKAVRRFLIRRVTSISVNGEGLTKNLYRREWRNGGVVRHDEPIAINDDRRRLILALVQKKVAELLGDERFKSSFQIGMLASFESFFETAKVKKDEGDYGNFDDVEQADDDRERDGIDVADINRISRDYRKHFNSEMPHPKMDEVVQALSSCWERARKSLIFVRRVASVKELEQKLDDSYNEWLFERLRKGLPASVLPRLDEAINQYLEERRQARVRSAARDLDKEYAQEGDDAGDEGGIDTFFAWYFRGEGPRGIVSGANVQQRFVQRGTVYATFFEDNHIAEILGAEPGGVKKALAEALKVSEETLDRELRELSKRFLGAAKKISRSERFEAAQAAAVEWLHDTPGEFQHRAKIVWHELYSHRTQRVRTQDAPEIGDILETKTFFTELRKRPELRKAVWPESEASDDRVRFQEAYWRAQMLASAARLGHAFIDLYVMTIRRLDSLELRVQEEEDELGSAQASRIEEYISLLERQMRDDPNTRIWGAFDELNAIARNFNLILDVNAPDVRNKALGESKRLFGQLLRKQQPVGGMFGQVNETLVRQFRMPGYPLVLITTDLLQEGEDLHTFCSSVQHYGISWTPSSMEQRIGRIDRVRSETDRRLSALKRPLEGPDKLQVYFPYLQETIEVLQVQRVLERMYDFLRLMHEGLVFPVPEEKKIDVGRDILRPLRKIPPVEGKLRTAFDVRDELLHGEVASPRVGRDEGEAVEARFDMLSRGALKDLEVLWESYESPGKRYGTLKIGDRTHPFRLELDSYASRAVMRCVSPIGQIDAEEVSAKLADFTAKRALRICASALDERKGNHEFTVEGDVLLGDSDRVAAARAAELIIRVTSAADQIEFAVYREDKILMRDFHDSFDQESADDD